MKYSQKICEWYQINIENEESVKNLLQIEITESSDYF